MKLPIGIDGFGKIRTNGFRYVERRMFIRELLEYWGKVRRYFPCFIQKSSRFATPPMCL